MKCVSRNSDKMLVGIFSDDRVVDVTNQRCIVTHPDSTRMVYPFPCESYTVTPPTNDDHRYTYDPATNTFTDTWPYAELSKVQFIDRLQNDGGMTDANLVASRNDANLEAFWLKFQLAESISRDDAKTDAGLNALVSLGYLTSAGKQAIMDNWGRERP